MLDELNYKTWPFLEAQKILEKKIQNLGAINNDLKSNGQIDINFETGYGPSGLPHIGTFCEVFRTSMVIAALKFLIKSNNIEKRYGIKFNIRLICFSDDVDGLKKIPSNIPNQIRTSKYIGQPLTSIPDPFDEKSSYGEYMNDKLKSFLDTFGLEYEFMSATNVYKSGAFNNALHKVAVNYEKIMNIMLPSLREERQRTYSPFLPICPKTNKVLQAKVIEVDPIKNEIIYINEDNEEVRTSILDGRVKLQWKVDFAMRWMDLKIDYEMYGADHQPNGKIYAKICKALGGEPPIQFFYSLFLDSEGNKISKSKGNSISIDEWLTYAPIESLALYAYNNPSSPKRLYFDVIPKITDDYIKLNKDYWNLKEKYLEQKQFSSQNQILNQGQVLEENPTILEEELTDKALWLIHNAIFIKDKDTNIDNIPCVNLGKINFTLLLNLACACNPENKEIMYGFIKKYDSKIEINAFLEKLVNGAMLYYENFIKPYKKYLKPDEKYIEILEKCINYLESIKNQEVLEEEIQNNLYSLGKKYYEPKDLRVFFNNLYKILLGQEDGPRFGSFIKLFGVNETIQLIKSKL